MSRRQTSDTRGPTLDEFGKPRTTRETDAQIEVAKQVRETGHYPPDPPDKDPGIEIAVERESRDRSEAPSKKDPPHR